MSKNEIAKTQTTEVAIPNQPRQGFEVSCQREDLIVPRAKLFNGLPKEYEDYPDAKPGQLLNNITKEVLPSVFVPIMRHIEWIRFNAGSAKLPDGSANPAFDKAFEPSEVIWRSTDPNDPRVIAESVWGPNGEKPLALKFLNFLSYFPGSSMPVMVSFYKTSLNAGKAVNSVLEYSQGAMFAHSFKLSSKITKTGEHSHYVLQATYNGKTNPEDYLIAEHLYNSLKGANVQAKTEFTE